MKPDPVGRIPTGDRTPSWIVVWNVPSKVDPGPLKHTWLERRLLPLLKRERSAWLEAAPGRPLPSPLEGITGRIKEARELLAALVDGYSPAQLVDREPLRVLPDDIKKIIQDAIHRAYLDLRIIQPLASELEAAIKQLEKVVEKVVTAWANAAAREMRARVLEELEVAAERLRRALEALPRGVVLP